MKKIFAITINYNSVESTEKLLDSLKKSKTSGFILHTIVVDNSLKAPLKSNSKNIDVIIPDINTGFSGGNNIGIKKAIATGCDYILLVNNDAIVESNAIIKMVEVLKRNESTGAVVPKIYFSKGQEFHKNRYKKEELGRVLWFSGGFIDWQNVKSVHRGMDEVDYGQHDRVEKTDFATGCCVLIKREVFEKIGFFDEKYFLYYEDADLSERINHAGYEIYYVPQAVVYHDNAGSTGGSGSPLHDYFLTRNQMLFGMKYAPFKTKLALLRQSLKLLLTGREYQRKGIRDFYLKKFGKGTFF